MICGLFLSRSTFKVNPYPLPYSILFTFIYPGKTHWGELTFFQERHNFLTSLVNEGQPLSQSKADLPYFILYYPLTGCGRLQSPGSRHYSLFWEPPAFPFSVKHAVLYCTCRWFSDILGMVHLHTRVHAHTHTDTQKMYVYELLKYIQVMNIYITICIKEYNIINNKK